MTEVEPSSSLPDLDMSVVDSKAEHSETTQQSTIMPPPAVVAMTSTATVKSKGRPPKAVGATQAKARTKSTTNVGVAALNAGPTQVATQLRRTQSVKKQAKKNNAGEHPIHLAVMNVSARESLCTAKYILIKRTA